MYQNLAEIYAALEQTRGELLTKIESLTPAQQNARENESGWSVGEIVEHLALVEGGALKVAQKLLRRAEENGAPSDGKITLSPDFAGKLAGLRDRKVVAPEMVHPQGEQSLTDSLAKLKEIRRALGELQARLEKIDAAAPTFPHPLFGEFNIYQWLIIVGLHERRHLSQIKRILESN